MPHEYTGDTPGMPPLITWVGPSCFILGSRGDQMRLASRAWKFFDDLPDRSLVCLPSCGVLAWHAFAQKENVISCTGQATTIGHATCCDKKTATESHNTWFVACSYRCHSRPGNWYVSVSSRPVVISDTVAWRATLTLMCFIVPDIWRSPGATLEWFLPFGLPIGFAFAFVSAAGAVINDVQPLAPGMWVR